MVNARIRIGKLRRLLILNAIVMVTALPGRAAEKEWVRESSIVFAGEVTHVGNSAVADIPPRAEMLIVCVRNVYQKPKTVELSRGDVVTVKAKQPAEFSVGDVAVFFTNGAVFGERIAVSEVGHTPLVASAAKTADASIGLLRGAPQAAPGKAANRIGTQISNEAFNAELQTADAVVVGRVTAIRTPAAAELQAESVPITEHDPKWREAVVKVEETLQGAGEGEELVVRYSNSIDVQWFLAPKLKLGQKGTFLLKRDTVSGAQMATLEGKEVQAYTALSPASFVIEEDTDRVKRLIQGEESATPEVPNGPLRGAPRGDATDEVDRIRTEIKDEALSAELQAADAVVVGRVTAIREPSVAALLAANLPITEHDPEWREAVVKVEQAIKGGGEGEELVVRYSNSIDVQWFLAPKLKVGEKGTFLLKRDTVSGAQMATLEGKEVQAYTALSPASFVIEEDTDRVKRLIPRDK